MSKLIKCFPKWLLTEGAIFTSMADLQDATERFPWLSKAQRLDQEYIGNHSGDKTVSPLLDKFIEMNAENENPFELTTVQRLTLADIIMNKFANKWTRLYEIEGIEFNPIENYSMVEEEVPDISKKRKASNDYVETDVKKIDRDTTRTERATDDYSETDTTKVKSDFTVNTSNNNENDNYGFNSNSPVPVAESAGGINAHTSGAADDNVTTQTHDKVGGIVITEEADGNENKETNTHTMAGYIEETENGSRRLTRSGNIGVTTSQQMAQSSIDLWQWNFIESVFADVDTVLTIPIYQIFNKGVYK